MEKLFLFGEIFIFIISIMTVIKNGYSFMKVYAKKEGKVFNDEVSKLLFVFAFSYIITILIVGF